MPRLSVIIPHQRDDERLEASVLAVLENRPDFSRDDLEVIVVHDGSYRDPYKLDDEVLFVETDARASVVEMLNAGIMAACAPVVNTIADGVQVSRDWYVSALETLESDRQLASVSVPIHRKSQRSYGIDSRAIRDVAQLRRGTFRMRDAKQECAAAEIACGFFRRSVLLALGGFHGQNRLAVAELDMANALQALALEACCETTAIVTANKTSANEAGSPEIAQVAAAYGIVDCGFASAARELIAGLFSIPSSALSWASTIASASAGTLNKRVQTAKQQLAEREEQDRLRLYVREAPRRAA